jgi:hypothetical protein
MDALASPSPQVSPFGHGVPPVDPPLPLGVPMSGRNVAVLSQCEGSGTKTLGGMTELTLALASAASAASLERM